MPLPMSCVSRTLAIVVLFAAPALSAQHAKHSVPGAQPVPATAAGPTAISDSAMPLYREALGPFTRNAGSASRDAQSYFDQGMQLMYSFVQPEAVRSFCKSQRRDSTCAACYWGEAWSRGAYLNSRMDSAGGSTAYVAAQYDEPEPLNFSAADWLGASRLEKGRAADAERVLSCCARASSAEWVESDRSRAGADETEADCRCRRCSSSVSGRLGAVGHVDHGLALLKQKPCTTVVQG